jgi:hypothetical protein
MSQERRRQANKILDVRQRGVDIAEAELAALARKADEANAEADRARAVWSGRLESKYVAVCSSDDLEMEDSYVRSLETTAIRLAAAAREAKAREANARAKVCGAKTEHKKVETWRDRLVEALTFEQARIERIQGDEVAARISRK